MAVVKLPLYLRCYRYPVLKNLCYGAFANISYLTLRLTVNERLKLLVYKGLAVRQRSSLAPAEGGCCTQEKKHSMIAVRQRREITSLYSVQCRLHSYCTSPYTINPLFTVSVPGTLFRYNGILCFALYFFYRLWHLPSAGARELCYQMVHDMAVQGCSTGC